MFDKDRPAQKTQAFPRNLEQMSLDDLGVYIKELDDEKQRVQLDMEKKKVSSEAANAFFK